MRLHLAKPQVVERARRDAKLLGHLVPGAIDALKQLFQRRLLHACVE